MSIRGQSINHPEMMPDGKDRVLNFLGQQKLCEKAIPAEY